jgi:hypothetical protein
MKVIIVLICLLHTPIFSVFAQDLPFYKKMQPAEEEAKMSKVDKFHNNILKFNPGRLLLGSLNLSYERIVSKHQTVNVRIKYHPLGYIERSIDHFSASGDNYSFDLVDKPHFYHFGVDAEYRFYVKNKMVAHGFYLAPYARYFNTSGKLESRYTGSFSGDPVQIDGTLKTTFNVFGLGAQTGVQWLINDKVSIDWSFAGIGVDWYVFSVGVSSDNLKNTVDKYSSDLQNVLGGVSGFLSRKLAFSALDKELHSSVPFWMVGWKSSLTVGIVF